MRALPGAILLMGALASPAASAPKAFAIRSVSVEHDGQWRSDPNGRQTPEDCRRFRLSPAIAQRWFAKAKDIARHEWFELLDWTQCSASGTLLTGQGKTYRWELDQSGRGRIILSPSVSVYLAGPELRFKSR